VFSSIECVLLLLIGTHSLSDEHAQQHLATNLSVTAIERVLFYRMWSLLLIGTHSLATNFSVTAKERVLLLCSLSGDHAQHHLATIKNQQHKWSERALALEIALDETCAKLRYASTFVGLFCAFNRSLLPYGRPLLTLTHTHTSGIC